MRRGRPDASAERRTENGPAAHQRKNLLKGGRPAPASTVAQTGPILTEAAEEIPASAFLPPSAQFMKKPDIRSLFHSITSSPNGRESHFESDEFAPVLVPSSRAGPFRAARAASCLRAKPGGRWFAPPLHPCAGGHSTIPMVSFDKSKLFFKSNSYSSNDNHLPVKNIISIDAAPALNF